MESRGRLGAEPARTFRPSKSSTRERAGVAGMNWRYGALLVGAVLVAGCGGAVQAAQGPGTGTVQGTFGRVTLKWPHLLL